MSYSSDAYAHLCIFNIKWDFLSLVFQFVSRLLESTYDTGH